MCVKFTVFLIFCFFNSSVAPSIDGDVTIAGFYRIYDKPSELPYGHKTVRNLNPNEILLSEAHLFSVKYVNEHLFKDKEFKLGTSLKSYEFNESQPLSTYYTVQTAVNIFQYSHDFCSPRVTGSDDHSDCVHNGPTFYGVSSTFDGAPAEMIDMGVLGAYCMPAVASMSKDRALDDTQNHPLFLHILPSYIYDAIAVYELLVNQSWTHVRLFYEDPYFYKSFYSFNEEFDLICMEGSLPLGRTNKNDTYRLEDQMSDLKVGPKVFVVQASSEIVPSFLTLLGNVTDILDQIQIIWVTGTSWQLIDMEYRELFDNTIVVQHDIEPLQMFEDYLTKLKLGEVDNKWLGKLFREQHQCGFVNNILYPKCTSNETLKFIHPDVFRAARLVFRSIYVMADALNRAQEDHCHGSNNLCKNMMESLDAYDFYKYLQTTNYSNDIDSFAFSRYDANSGPMNFTIYQYQNKEIVPIGWYNKAFELELDPSKYIKREIPYDSQCFKQCPPDQVKVHATNCCFRCLGCPPGQVMNKTSYTCYTCPFGTIMSNKTCVDTHMTTYLINVVCSLYGLALLLTVFAFGTIFYYRNTPLARASVYIVVLIMAVVLCIEFTLGASVIALVFSGHKLPCVITQIIESFNLYLLHSLSLYKSIRLARPAWYRRFEQEPSVCKFLFCCGLPGFFCMLFVVAYLLVFCVWLYVWLYIDFLSSPNPNKLAFIECETSSGLILFALPCLYLILSIYYLRMALKCPFLYIVYQARFAFGGFLCLFVIYFTALLLYFLRDGLADEESFYYFLTFLPAMVGLISGYIFWFTTVFPIAYTLLYNRKRNVEGLVRRRRAELFRSGNVISMITPVVCPELPDTNK